DFLKNNGYRTEKFSYQTSVIKYPKIEPLLTITSPPLSEIVYWFNQKSINLYGEQLVRILGEKFGKNASAIEGIKVINDYWEKKGIDSDALRILDGSGLSPSDRV